MAKSTSKRLVVLRAVVSLLIAIALWGIASLSDIYDTTVNVPFNLDLPADLAPAQEAPQFIEVTVRAKGWSLLKMLATGRTEVVIHPLLHSGGGDQVITLTSRDLLNNLRTNVTDAQELRVSPDSLTLVIGHVASKQVPLYPEVTINTRDGFQVIGALRIAPDSVLLTGSARALQEIATWPTQPLTLNDVHGPIRQRIRISDTLQGVVTPFQQVAELRADVQEIAERGFVEIPLINRGAIRDTSLTLLLEPDHVDALIRGGAQDLSRLTVESIAAYVDIQEGIDTLGLARPHLVLPPGFTAVRIRPERIRYLFRRTASR